MRRFAFALSTGLVLASAQVALAHVALRAPIVRDDAMKDGPCGAVASTRGTNVCTFRPGQTITISFDETVEHAGHFRVAFDTDGQDFINPTTPDDTDPTVINNNVLDRVTTPDDMNYTLDITFPNVECANCTLQLIQVMSTAATYDEGDLYYQCADIVLSNAAPETPDPACVAPPPDDGGDPPDDGSGGDDSGDPPDDGSGGTGGDPEHSGAEGGCAVAAGGGGSAGGTVLLLLGALLLQGRRRRTK